MSLFAVASVSSRRDACDRFRAENPAYPLTHGFVQDPAAVDRAALVAGGVLRADNIFAPFALAQMLAHVAIWRHCAAEGRVMHVADDRAVIRADFTTVIEAHAADPSGFDILVWGFDFADPAQIVLAPGVAGRLLCDQSRHPPDMPLFRAGRSPITRFGLLYCATACGYTLSPAGAQKLLDRCIPFGAESLPYFGEANRVFANSGIDREMARHYPALAAYLIQPVLAVLPAGGAPPMITQHFLAAFYHLAGQPRLKFPA